MVIGMSTHPYMPNSVPKIKEEMYREIGISGIDELIRKLVPEDIIFNGELNLPEAISELELKRHLESVLSKNKITEDLSVFLGAGSYPHFVPSLCDEIYSRSEFATAYVGDVYGDYGKFQALFEFQSMVGDLLEMDVVSLPTYDGVSAAGEAARIPTRVTGRKEILVPKIINQEKISTIENYVELLADVKLVDYDPETGQLDIEDLKEKISSETAGVFIENPSYLGVIETQTKEIGEVVHDHGAIFVVGVNDPLSLGVLSAPGDYGADVVYAEGQPLGLHMGCGGISLGVLACRDEPTLVEVMPQLFLSVTKTAREGELGFSWFALPERMMYVAREKCRSFVGTSAGLHAIVAGVYLALMGPQGIRELAELIMYRSHYAIKKISQLSEIKAPVFKGSHFEEFTVNFTNTGKTVKEINKALLEHGIQGGKDLSREFPELGNTALYCVTELHTKEDLDKLVSALEEVI